MTTRGDEKWAMKQIAGGQIVESIPVTVYYRAQRVARHLGECLLLQSNSIAVGKWCDTNHIAVGQYRLVDPGCPIAERPEPDVPEGYERCAVLLNYNRELCWAGPGDEGEPLDYLFRNPNFGYFEFRHAEQVWFSRGLDVWWDRGLEVFLCCGGSSQVIAGTLEPVTPCAVLMRKCKDGDC